MARLHELLTDEGLIPTSYLKWRGSELFMGDSTRVYVEPSIRGVVEFLRQRPVLWKAAQIRVVPARVYQKRAPVFGVPFDVALSQLKRQEPGKGIIKSMYKRIDEEAVRHDEWGVLATLVAHVSRRRKEPDLLALEAWECLDLADGDTFYFHGILSRSTGCFIHVDGSTMYHGPDAKALLFQHGCKVRGAAKKKHFLIDGVVQLTEVRDLAREFLPLEDLTCEYVLEREETTDA